MVIQTAEYDGLGRRIKKVVTNAGALDKTVVYLYEGWKILETQDGSDNVVQQYIWGMQYIDELVMVRVKDKGDLYVHQDANWNVVALTDLGTHLVERYVYTPYGELIVEQETSFGDRDGDGDVDSTDKGTVGVDCTGTVTGSCRILDLDFDGDYDSSDATLFDSLPSGIARHPGRASTGVDQPFAHQGLLFDAELGSCQNRHRQYDPAKRRFMQRDPLGMQSTFFRAQGFYQDGMSLYQYTGSNPTRYLDHTGLAKCDTIMAQDSEITGSACIASGAECPWGQIDNDIYNALSTSGCKSRKSDPCCAPKVCRSINMKYRKKDKIILQSAVCIALDPNKPTRCERTWHLQSYECKCMAPVGAPGG